jgi:hypothetical protein
MDTAVALVQSYLYMNGYFTVTEYPVLELMSDGEYRTVTDVDVLAVRIPGAGRDDNDVSGSFVSVDPDLDVDLKRIDLIIAEVKEGRAELNASARDPKVLRAALNRFGALGEERTSRVIAAYSTMGKRTIRTALVYDSWPSEHDRRPTAMRRTNGACSATSLVSCIAGSARTGQRHRASSRRTLLCRSSCCWRRQ